MKTHPLLCMVFPIIVMAAPDTTQAPTRPLAPITATQLYIAVEMSGVPQKVNTKGKVRALSINLRKLGHVQGLVAIKVYFLGKASANNEIVVNSVISQEVEATAGGGSTYRIQSKPFVFTEGRLGFNKTAPKPSKGIRPYGWVVRVYQDEKLITETASCRGYEPWIEGH